MRIKNKLPGLAVVTIGQLGSPRQRRRAYSLLLSEEEMQDGEGYWRLAEKFCWRTGVGDGQFEEDMRAGDSGAFVAFRRFERETTKENLLVQVFPYASHADAMSAVSKRTKRLLARDGFAKYAGQNYVLPEDVLSHATTFSYDPVKDLARSGVALMCQVDSVVLFVTYSFSSLEDFSLLLDKARQQAGKIHEVLRTAD